MLVARQALATGTITSQNKLSNFSEPEVRHVLHHLTAGAALVADVQLLSAQVLYAAALHSGL